MSNDSPTPTVVPIALLGALAGAKPNIPDTDIEARRRWMLHQSDVQAEQYAAAIATVGLPDLVGSERQVAWATDLRHQWIVRRASQTHQSLQRARRAGVSESAIRADYDAHSAELWGALGHLEATYWIDHRPVTADEIYWTKRIKALGYKPSGKSV